MTGRILHFAAKYQWYHTKNWTVYNVISSLFDKCLLYCSLLLSFPACRLLDITLTALIAYGCSVDGGHCGGYLAANQHADTNAGACSGALHGADALTGRLSTR